MAKLTTRLSPNGPEISRISWGMMRLREDPTSASPQTLVKKIKDVIDLGINTFDHADIYNDHFAEEIFGTALAHDPGLRKEIKIITKCGTKLISKARPEHVIKHYDHRKERIIACVERSLKNLKTDHIDILLMHRPSPLLDPDEVAEAITLLKADGKVLHLGVSNFTLSQMAMIQSRVPIVTNQVEISPLHVDPMLDGVFDKCIEMRVKPMAWAPIARGKIFISDDPRAVRLRAALEELAEKYAVPVDQLIYAWLARHPSQMAIVVGSNRLERLGLAVSALSLDMEIQDWFKVWTAYLGHEVA